MQIEARTFRGLDLETEAKQLPNGAYRYGLNVRINHSEGDNTNAVENIKGNLQIPYALPAGINTVIGSYENKVKQECIYFVHNSLGTHSILKYSPLSGVTLIFQGEILNFQVNYLITGVAVVENMLFWTDHINPPRKINIPKAESNLYLTPYLEQQIDLIKHPPLYPPVVTLGRDTSKLLNYVSGKTFQFRLRYIYHDFEKSALSPISALPIDYFSFNPKISEYNYIQIDFGIDLLGNNLPIQLPQVRDIIRGVEILVRESNEGDWRLVDTIGDYAIKNYRYRFYNDGNYSAIDSANAVKLFDSVPIFCKALSVMKDRIFTANHTEGYDLIPINVEFDISFLEYGKKPLDVEIEESTLTFDLTDNTDRSWSFFSNPSAPTNSITELIVGTFTAPANFSSDIVSTVDFTAINLQFTASCNLILVKNNTDTLATWGVSNGDTLVTFTASNVFLQAGDTLTLKIVLAATYIPADGQLPEELSSYEAAITSARIRNENISGSSSPAQTPSAGHLKRGGTYQYGLVYYDRANRSSSVNWQGTVIINQQTVNENIAKFSLPFLTEDLNKYYPTKYPANTFVHGIPQISWKIKHTPPLWATHYAWVRTKNTAYSRYLQFVVQNAVYVREFQQTEITPAIPKDRPEYNKYEIADAVITSFGAGDATEIYLDMENIVYFKDKNSDSTINTFVPDGGDRVRFMVKKDGTWFEYTDVPIKLMRGKYLVISLKDFKGLTPELTDGVIVELYTPKLASENELFYEISETYPILNPHTVNRSHSKGQTRPNAVFPAQDQNGVTPASGTFQSGDNYYRLREMFVKTPVSAGAGNFTAETAYPFFIEDTSISDFYPSEDSDIGRPNAIVFADRQVNRKTAVRFSNKFLSGTKINGLNEFEALNEKLLPVEYGAITKLQVASNNQNEGNVMIALHETEAVSMYINEAQFRDTGTAQVIAVSDEVIPSFNTLRGGHGCVHPESVAQEDGNVYWFDAKRGAVCRYNLNGAFPISSYGMGNYFYNLGKRAIQTPQKVVGVFDSLFKEYLISFSNEQETHRFSEKANLWEGRLSALPQYFGRVGNQTLHFLNGDTWLASANDLYNNFFGIQYASELHYITNQNPETDKVFMTHFVHATGLWVAYEVTNDNGQLSTLIQDHYKPNEGGGFRIESAYYADLLRDVNTPAVANPLFEGDEMRSQYLFVKLRNENPTYQRLFASGIGYIVSSGA